MAALTGAALTLIKTSQAWLAFIHRYHVETVTAFNAFLRQVLLSFLWFPLCSASPPRPPLLWG